MTILEKIKKAGLNPLTVKYIVVTELVKPVTFIGSQYNYEYWLNRAEKIVYKIEKRS